MEPPCARWISPLARRLADRVSASLHVRRNPGWYIGRLEVHRVQLVILPGRQTDFHHQTAASVDDALEAIRIFWPSGSCRKARDVCLVPPRRPRHVSLPDQQDRPRPAWCVHIFAFALTIDHRPWTIDHGPWTICLSVSDAPLLLTLSPIVLPRSFTRCRSAPRVPVRRLCRRLSQRLVLGGPLRIIRPAGRQMVPGG